MICNTQLKKKMKFVRNKFYQRAYQYVCSDGFQITIVDTNKTEKGKDLKNDLLKHIKNHLFEKGLEE